jgi:hypothetical protein
VDIKERLGEDANLMLEIVSSKMPPHLLERGWIGNGSDPSHPDVIVHIGLKDAGLIGLWPASSEARHLLADVIGMAGEHRQDCPIHKSDDPPPPAIGTLSQGGLVVVSLPVWLTLSEEILSKGMTIEVDRDRPQSPESPLERGEGGRAQQEDIGRLSFSIDEAGVMNFAPEGGKEKTAEADLDERTDKTLKMLDQAEKSIQRVANVSRISHMVYGALGDDLQDGIFGAEPPEPPEGEAIAFEVDIVAGLDAPSGMILMHPHNEKGLDFLRRMADAKDQVVYAYRAPWAAASKADLSLEEIVDDRYPEYVASIISWTPLILMAELLSVSIGLSTEEDYEPCFEDADDDDDAEMPH